MKLKFVMTPTNVMIFALRVIVLGIPHFIRVFLLFITEKLDAGVEWVSEKLPQVKMEYTEGEE